MRTKVAVLFFFFSIHITHAQFQRSFNVGKDSLNLYYVDFKDTIPKIGKSMLLAPPYWESFVIYYPKFGFGFAFNGWRQTAHSTNDESKKDIYGNFYPFQLKNASQCIITVPKPTNVDSAHYTVFTSDSLGNKNNKFYYTYVNDRKPKYIDGVRIGCIVKGKQLMEGPFQAGGITACKHGNGEDWWTILADNKQERFYAVLMDKDTIKLHHTQDIPCYFDNKEKNWAEFSPDGKYYVRYQQWGKRQHVINIYDFDRCSGKLSNHRFYFHNETEDSKNGGICISPNSKYLYYSTGYSLFQLSLSDLLVADIEIASTADTSSACGTSGCGFNRMTIAPDEKLYIIDENEAYLHIIDKPNEKGLACGLRRGTKGMELPVENNVKVFPNHVNYSLGKAACFVATSDIASQKELLLVPNPGAEQFTIQSKENEHFDVEIFNAVGQLIFQANDTNEIDASTWNSGFYIVNLSQNGVFLVGRKWVKM
jgi:hypothetical protein